MKLVTTHVLASGSLPTPLLIVSNLHHVSTALGHLAKNKVTARSPPFHTTVAKQLRTFEIGRERL